MRGVVWVPGETNLGEKPARYSPALEVYAKSLAGTYGQERVRFVYAQPNTALVEGLTAPTIKAAASVTFDAWPKSLNELGTELGKAAAKQD